MVTRYAWLVDCCAALVWHVERASTPAHLQHKEAELPECKGAHKLGERLGCNEGRDDQHKAQEAGPRADEVGVAQTGADEVE